MNITIFTSNYLPYLNGASISAGTFKSEAEKKGNNVYVFAPTYPNHVETDPNIIRVPSIRAPTHAEYQLPLFFLPKITKKFNDLAVDVMYVQQPFFIGDIGVKLAKKKNIPVVFMYHTLYEDYVHYFPFHKGLTKMVCKKITASFCNKCDLVIAPSSYIKELLVRRGVKTKIKVLPTGINIEDYKKDFEKNKIKKEFNLAEDSIMLLYAGRIAREKNLGFLVKCMEKIIKENPKVVCFLAGGAGDNYGKKLKAMVKSDKIIFTGNLQRDRLREFYNESDLFIFSSKSETQGLVIIEAMAGKTPVVAIDAPFVRDFVEDGENGYLVSENVDCFSDTVLGLLKDKEKLKKFSKNACKTAENYSCDKITDELLKEFEMLKQ